jgi:protein-disulfide isomerase
LTKVFRKLYNPFMPKRITNKTAPTLELKKPTIKVDFKLPLKVRLENINFKKFLPKSSNQVLVALLIIAAFLIGVLFTKVQYLEKNQVAVNKQQPAAAAPAAQGNQQQPAAPALGAKVNVGVGKFPIKGDANAKVTIIEFADFRCPFCEQFFTNTESQIISDYVNTGKVKFAFRNFAFLGPASVTAADAAECANDQGKFWDYHDYLYKNQPSESDTSMYNTDTLTQAAVSLGMDGNTFRTCLDGKKGEANANADLADGQKAGVSGTPSFFVNGTPLVGAEPYSAFKTIIDKELAK